jgi:hypothetical protein
MAKKRGPKPRVEYDGKIYSCRRYNVEIPDLGAMSRTGALVWLLQNTTPVGYSRNPGVNLAGLGEAIRLEVR